MTAPDGAAYWTTEVSDVEQANVYVRGYSLGDMIGRLPFSAATYLVIRGRIPTRGEARMVDAMLCSILDYALYKPGTVAARYTVSGNPNMQAGMAVAVMSVGEYTLAPDDSVRFIIDSYDAFRASGEGMGGFAEKFVAQYTASGNRVPGFGHPVFRHLDPRAQRLKQIAQQEGWRSRSTRSA